MCMCSKSLAASLGLPYPPLHSLPSPSPKICTDEQTGVNVYYIYVLHYIWGRYYI